MKYKKLSFCSLIISVLMILSGYFFDRKSPLLCGNRYSECTDILNYVFGAPIYYLGIFLSVTFFILLFLSEKYRKIGFFTTMIFSIPVFFGVFTSDSICGSFLCDKRAASIMLGMLYPVILIIVLLISYIYFKVRNKRRP